MERRRRPWYGNSGVGGRDQGAGERWRSGGGNVGRRGFGWDGGGVGEADRVDTRRRPKLTPSCASAMPAPRSAHGAALGR
jgi:hypothetical protein